MVGFDYKVRLEAVRTIWRLFEKGAKRKFSVLERLRVRRMCDAVATDFLNEKLYFSFRMSPKEQERQLRRLIKAIEYGRRGDHRRMMAGMRGTEALIWFTMAFVEDGELGERIIEMISERDFPSERRLHEMAAVADEIHVIASEYLRLWSTEEAKKLKKPGPHSAIPHVVEALAWIYTDIAKKSPPARDEGWFVASVESLLSAIDPQSHGVPVGNTVRDIVRRIRHQS